jgi:hypothetical protein
LNFQILKHEFGVVVHFSNLKCVAAMTFPFFTAARGPPFKNMKDMGWAGEEGASKTMATLAPEHGKQGRGGGHAHMTAMAGR